MSADTAEREITPAFQQWHEAKQRHEAAGGCSWIRIRRFDLPTDRPDNVPLNCKLAKGHEGEHEFGEEAV